MEKLVYTAKETADVLGVSLPTVYALCKSVGFPCVWLSERRVVVPVDMLKSWLERQAGGVKSDG